MQPVTPPERYPCGKIKRSKTIQQIAEAEKKVQEHEMATVLAQPHRQGSRSQLSENAFGRFILAHKLRRELYDAGVEYYALRRRLVNIWGGPRDGIKLDGNGSDVTTEQASKWKHLIREWDVTMEGAGGYLGRLGVVALTFAVGEPQAKIYPEKVIAALMALAVFQGRVDVNEKGVDTDKNLVNFRSRT